MNELAHPAPEFEGRLGALLDVAAAHDAPIALDELADLLPPEAPADAPALGRWLEAHPEVGRVADGQALAHAASVRDQPARRDRADRYLAEARYVSAVALAPARPLLRTLAVTGSTAYGLVDRDDDLDFMAVTRPGALWVFLAFAYYAARFRRAPDGAHPDAVWCFNYVLDESEAKREFATARGLLFAREALTARPLQGRSFYAGLIQASPGIRSEVPRLHARRSQPPPAEPEGDPTPAPLLLRALNVLAFPLLAAYLQAVGLVRNARLRRTGEAAKAFRVVTTLRRMALETARFAELEATYARRRGEGRS